MDEAQHYLQAYDEQLRTDAETPSALRVDRLGPLRLVTFAGGRGFITYRDLGGAGSGNSTDTGTRTGTGTGTIDQMVSAALQHFVDDPSVDRVEWKTRGHDRAPGLHEALVARGFTPGEPESIMIGRVADLADTQNGGDAPADAATRSRGQARPDEGLPSGARVRQVRAEAEVRAMSAMIDEAFGEAVDERLADALVTRLARGDGMELWVAEVDGRMVSGGRLEPVAGTEFVGIWGGATLPAFRGQGLYRAVTRARARSALALGKTLVHSDSTEFSRPILERSGLRKVSTTTPYTWTR